MQKKKNEKKYLGIGTNWQTICCFLQEYEIVWFSLAFKLETHSLFMLNTVPIRPYLTESKLQLNAGFTSEVYYGFTLCLQEQTQSKPSVNPKQTMRVNSD